MSCTGPEVTLLTCWNLPINSTRHINRYKCHHMEKVLLDPDQDPDEFAKAYQERTADWDKVFEGYDAAVDWPAAEFWPELVEKYPDAKVILTVRDPEDWYRSVGKTIKEWPMDPALQWPERMLKTRNMARIIVKEGALREYSDKDAMISKFLDNNLSVKAAIAEERLLVFHPGDGWAPLCKFLGQSPPETEFPHCNRGGDFVGRLNWVRESIESGRNLSAM